MTIISVVIVIGLILGGIFFFILSKRSKSSDESASKVNQTMLNIEIKDASSSSETEIRQPEAEIKLKSANLIPPAKKTRVEAEVHRDVNRPDPPPSNISGDSIFSEDFTQTPNITLDQEEAKLFHGDSGNSIFDEEEGMELVHGSSADEDQERVPFSRPQAQEAPSRSHIFNPFDEDGAAETSSSILESPAPVFEAEEIFKHTTSSQPEVKMQEVESEELAAIHKPIDLRPQTAPAPVSQMDPEEEKAHEKAKRIARVIINDIRNYNPEKLAEGIRSGNIMKTLGVEIERGRQLYIKRVPPEIAKATNYYRENLIKILADGRSDLFGW
jgi:hypothetical protein